MRINAPSQPAPGVAETLALLPPLALFRVLGHAPTALDPWLGLGGTLLTTLELDPVLRELSILQVAADTGCEYEQRQHEEIGAGVGVSLEQARAIREKRLDAAELAPHTAVLGFVHEVATSHRASEQSFAALATELPERQVVELLLVVGHYLGIAVLINALAIEPEAPDGLAVLGLQARADGS